MKLLLLCGALAPFLLSLTGFAQEVALPGPDLAGAASPSPRPAETPPPPIIPPGLLALPDEPPPRPQLPEIPQLDEGFKPAPLSPEAENQRKHVEWRRLRNAFQNDTDVRAALETAREARTDLEKRKLLGRYYDLFYGRMIARATPEMKGYLLERKREAVGALPQPRVRPGVAMSQTAGIAPSPTVAPKPTPLFRPPGVSN
ncbi:MAG: hypothetical protein ABIR71_13820 [Chthoniobacterales bacterium]